MRTNTRFLLLALTGLFTVSLLIAGRSVVLEDRTFTVSNFDRLDLGSAFTINVRQATGFSVRVSGRPEDIKDLEARVSGGTLKVENKDRNWWQNRNRQEVKVEITMPSLRGAEFSGASTVVVSGFRNQNQLDLDLSGASKLTMAIDADNLNLELSGASTARLSGRADQIKGEVSGASTVKAEELVSKTAQVEANGASTASFYVTTSMTAEASGASSIRYKGNASLTKQTSGASSVSKMN
jgi:Putative auto-transporter adhesin, head GIN domain